MKAYKRFWSKITVILNWSLRNKTAEQVKTFDHLKKDTFDIFSKMHWNWGKMNLQACHRALRSKTAMVDNEAPIVKCILQDFPWKTGIWTRAWSWALESALLPLWGHWKIRLLSAAHIILLDTLGLRKWKEKRKTLPTMNWLDFPYHVILPYSWRPNRKSSRLRRNTNSKSLAQDNLKAKKTHHQE